MVDQFDTSLNYIKLQPHNMRALLTQEALRWVGVQEENGDNKGQLVEIFQRAVTLEPGMPWCAAFVIYCLDRVKAQASCLDMYAPASKIYRTGHVLTMWNNSPIGNRVSGANVMPGDLMLWQLNGSDAGHVGIVLSNNTSKGSFQTIEGNTGPGVEVERNGDGVFIKNRLSDGYGTMQVLGWLRPWV
jgi:hypothetical protein